MNEQIDSRMRASTRDFLRVVWPVIGRGFGTPIPVETVTENAFAVELDRRAGIDMWLVGRDGHLRGLASRVQWPKTGRPFRTFTVRVRSRYGGPTEYDKRRAEIASPGALTPHYVCQAYVSPDHQTLLAAAVARMGDVISAVERGIGWLMPPNPDGTRGWAVPWSALADEGAPIVIWPGAAVMSALLFADLRHVLAGVPGAPRHLGLAHAAGDGLRDGSVQLLAPLREGRLGAAKGSRRLLKGVCHVAECDTG